MAKTAGHAAALLLAPFKFNGQTVEVKEKYAKQYRSNVNHAGRSWERSANPSRVETRATPSVMMVKGKEFLDGALVFTLAVTYPAA